MTSPRPPGRSGLRSAAVRSRKSSTRGSATSSTVVRNATTRHALRLRHPISRSEEITGMSRWTAAPPSARRRPRRGARRVRRRRPHGPGRRPDLVQSTRPPELPQQGPALPRRTHPDAARAPVRPRRADDRRRGGAQPRRRRPGTRAAQLAGARRVARRGLPAGAGPLEPGAQPAARPLPGDQWRRFEHQLTDQLGLARTAADACGARLAVIGILPTIEQRHLVVDALSREDRYAVLNEQLMSLRGEPIRLDIAGDDPSGRHSVTPDHLFADFDSIAPEAACTSMQLHLQVHPDAFAGYWNAAQCLAG